MFEPADRALWKGHFARAEERIAHGEKIIARQRAQIEELELANFETRSARQLLAEFEQLLRLQIKDRDWLGTAEPPHDC